MRVALLVGGHRLVLSPSLGVINEATHDHGPGLGRLAISRLETEAPRGCHGAFRPGQSIQQHGLAKLSEGQSPGGQHEPPR